MWEIHHFCVGFPQTLSGPTIFIYLFIFVREQSARHVVFGSIRKSEDPENECFFAVTPTSVITNVTFTWMNSRHRKKLHQQPTVLLDKVNRYRKFCVNCEYHFADIILFRHNNTMIRFSLYFVIVVNNVAFRSKAK